MIPAVILVYGYFRALIGILKDPAVKSLTLFILLLVIVGAFFYHQVEGWSYLNSVYFCVVTLATVGYGDLAPKTNPGKIFTIFYIMIGIGAFVTFASALAQKMSEKRETMLERHRKKVKKY